MSSSIFFKKEGSAVLTQQDLIRLYAVSLAQESPIFRNDPPHAVKTATQFVERMFALTDEGTSKEETPMVEAPKVIRKSKPNSVKASLL